MCIRDSDGYTLKTFQPDPFNQKASIVSMAIYNTYLGQDDRLYVGTNFGFSVLDPVTGLIENFNNRYDLQPTSIYGYTCLLYTSPSPRDRTRSRMPSSA